MVAMNRSTTATMVPYFGRFKDTNVVSFESYGSRGQSNTTFEGLWLVGTNKGYCSDPTAQARRYAQVK